MVPTIKSQPGAIAPVVNLELDAHRIIPQLGRVPRTQGGSRELLLTVGGFERKAARKPRSADHASGLNPMRSHHKSPRTQANIPKFWYINSMRIWEHLQQLSRENRKQYRSSDWAELAAIAASAVGTLAAAVLQQAAYAAAPLTLALFLNFLHRQRHTEPPSQDIPLTIAELEWRLSQLEEQLQHLPQPDRINLSEVYDELASVNKSLTMIEGKASFMAAKVYDQLSVQVDRLREQVERISEPLDLTRVEARIASLNVAVQFLAQRPLIDPQEHEKLARRLGQLEINHQKVVVESLERLNQETKHLQHQDFQLAKKVDALQQKFAARPEVAQISKLSRNVGRLTDSVNQIQHTEAIAALYDEIATITKELTRLGQNVDRPPDLLQIQQLQERQQSQIARLDRKFTEAIAALDKLRINS
ncbi:hypothetical protein [Phormidium sp. CCY1219]|uniref:hypothetical protein n=1 Tax=Phormidium sp. CCY1219 TaxID=2886104 RepID=UPI002D1F1CA9|nr:hypothetical protein [Phormidium sp. CCY1219]MEB3827196.1 ELKS/Rab6-interacting/CAST family protein [Phormidium sp. CCY1219]